MTLDFRTIQGYIDQQQGGSAGRGGDLVEFARTQAQELGVPVEIAEKLIRLESGGRADAVSPKGAFGPAQLMPGTAKELAAKYGGDPSDPYDNVRLGMHYLRDNYNQFGDWRLAAAAYQAGPGAVRRAGGIPNTTDGITRTPDYVRKVVPAGLGIGAMMPTPTVQRDSAPAAEPAAPMEEPDYSRFELLPTMRQGDAQPIYGLDDVTKQQAADAEQARLDALTLGDKAAMGFKKGAVQSVGLLGGLGAAVGDALDIESLQKAGMDLYTRQMEKAQEYSVAPSFTDVLDGKAEMSDWLAENIGYGVYQITEALATAGVGSLLLKGAMKPAAAGMMKGFVEREVVKTLASPIEAEARRLIAGGMAAEAARSAAEKTVAAKLGEQAIKAATEKAAKIAGATLAATANNFRQELGSIYGEAAENGTVDWEKILPAAAGATALDTLAEAYFGAKVLGTGGARSGGYASRLAKELPSQMVVQGGTEGGQSAIEQWGAGKEISGRQVVDEAAVGALMGGAGAPASAMPKAEEPIKPPAGVLGRAAEAGRSAGAMPADPNMPAGGGQGAAPAEGALPVGGVDERVRALLSKVQDGSGLLDRMRATDGFGPESATELLSAIAVARNPNMDPMQREAAAAGAERLLSLFEGRPNFTMPQDEAPAAGLPAVQQQSGGGVAVMPEPGATIDGEFSRYGGELADPAVPATRRLPPAAVRALPDPEKQRVLREAEAEYEQAFADLLKVEQLATSEQQLREAALARQYAEARLAEIQEAVAGAQAAYSAQVRRSLLDEILADPSTANPLERFEAEMRRQGYGEPAARPDEAARVQRFLDIREAQPAEPETEPSAPNEMDASALGVRERGARQSITPPARPSAPIQPLETGNVEAQERGNGGADAGVDQGVGRPGRGTEAGEALRADEAGEAVGVEGGGRGVDGVDQDAAVRTAGDVRQGVVAVDASGVAAAPLSEQSEVSAPAPEDQDKRAELDVAADVTNTAPSEAQKEAGNYQKGRVVVQGFRVAIENPKGSVRRGVDKDGTEWSVVMPADYGYIERTEGADGDQVDVFIGDQPETGLIFVVNQNKPDSTRFDEHKVMLGFSSEDAAIDTYFDSFAGGFGQRLFHSIDGPHTAEELRALLPKLKKAKPIQEKVPAGEAVPAEFSGERADLRPELEALIRMKAGARQIGKEDALQTVIDRAKSYMQGGAVEPGVFLVRSKQFKDMPVVQQTIAGIVDKIKTARAPAQGDSPVAEQPAADVRSAAERSAEPEAPAAEPAPLPNATAPEHVQTGVDDRELSQIVSEFNSAQQSMIEDGERVTHVFDPPAKKEVVRLNDKVKVFTKDNGWMTPEQARARIAEWKAHAQAQGDDPQIRSANSNKVVLSLFDLSGEWSKPWEEAGYQVFRFDIQDDPVVGDVNNFSTEFFNDWFGDFDGIDIYAVLAACPCTDFAVSGARHFAAKDKDGRTVASVKLVHQTLRAIEYFKPAVWAIENPVGRIEELGGLPPWRLSFDPNHLGDPYTKKTLLWGRFNGDLPIAPVEPTEGSKMHRLYGGKSQATKNARSVTPEGFSYGFFMANNAHDHPVMALANKFDRLDRELIKQAIDAGVPTEDIETAVEDAYYIEMDDEAGNQAIRDLISAGGPRGGRVVEQAPVAPESDNGPSLDEARDTLAQLRAQVRDQGRVSDDRLNERIRMFERLVAELEAEKAPAVPVPGIYGNGMPDPRNSPPLLELDGFKVGDRVRVKGRTVDDARIDALFKRALPGFDKPDHMARLTRGEGMTPLDVQVFSLEKIGGDTVSGNPLRAELEQMSGEELRAVMDRMSLAGARMTHDERVATLLAEDEAEVRAAMVAPVPAPAAAAEPEVRNPRTFDEFIGDVDAGYRAHFDYAGADGTTIWIEQTDKGWVVKQKDDDSSAVITKGGAGAGGGWGKLGALTAAKNLASYRFKEWKPVVAETSAQNERKAESGKSDYENDPYEREAARMEVRPIEGSDEFIVGYRADNGWHNFIRFALSEKTGRPVRVEYFYEHQSGRVPAKMALDRWVEGRKQAGSRQDSGKSEQQAPLASTASRQGAQPSANTIFTEDAAAKAREVLRRKLGQVNTGLDPEILQAGITLAGYHIEKGARKFAAYARAMLDDMGDAVKPYLKSWYMGVKYDPRAAAFTGDMSSAADVDAADVDSLGERAPAPVEVEGISKILERIDGDNGMYVNIAKSTSRAGGFNVMLRDGDAEETVSGLVNIPTLEQARTKANEMLGIKDAPAAAIDEKQQQADAVADAIGKAIAASPVIVEHVTGKGKTIRGIVRADLSKDEAKKIDPYTFRKDDGYFIREKYLDGMVVPPAAQKTQIEPGDIPPAFLRKHMVTTRVFVESEGAEVDVEMPADKALQLLADELERLRGVRACVEG